MVDANRYLHAAGALVGRLSSNLDLQRVLLITEMNFAITEHHFEEAATNAARSAQLAKQLLGEDSSQRKAVLYRLKFGPMSAKRILEARDTAKRVVRQYE